MCFINNRYKKKNCQKIVTRPVTKKNMWTII